MYTSHVIIEDTFLKKKITLLAFLDMNLKLLIFLKEATHFCSTKYNITIFVQGIC